MRTAFFGDPVPAAAPPCGESGGGGEGGRRLQEAAAGHRHELDPAVASDAMSTLSFHFAWLPVTSSQVRSRAS